MITLRRYTHACITVDVDGVSLVVDPGEFGTIPNLSTAAAVLITHDHFDHAHHAAIRAALETNPNLQVIGPQSVADSLDVPVTVVDGGDIVDVRGVRVEVYGHIQAVTSLNDPVIQNVGYLIANTVYHPGDALHELDCDVLCLPMEVPWAKNVDRELALRRHPVQRIIPIHDGTLNELGVQFAMHNAELLAKECGATVLPLRDGDSTKL